MLVPRVGMGTTVTLWEATTIPGESVVSGAGLASHQVSVTPAGAHAG
jgi:hypothetical protein